MPRRKSQKKGHWKITLDNGKVVETGYYPNPRMAIGEVLKKNRGRSVASVKYVK